MTDLSFGAETLAGLVLAMTRVGGFITASPYIGQRLPGSGRLAVTLGLSLFLSAPVATETLEVAPLVTAIVLNLVAGLILGLMTSMLFQAFSAAGAMVDVSSGMAVSAIFDPSMGTQSTIFQRFFDVTAVALFFVMGGHRLLLMGLATSVEVVGLDGNVRLDAGLGDLAVQTLSRYTLASLEIAVPILSALLLSELALGVASRLLPQANVFLLGLPLKILVVLAVVTVSVSSFPSIMGWLLESMEQTFTEVLAGLR